jgi:hypothetical protein
MSVTKVPYGKPVKLLVDYQGYPNGRLVQFEIWQKKGSEEKMISTVYGVTKGGKGLGWWVPLVDRKEVQPLGETLNYQGNVEKFYFIGKIDDKAVKSGDFVFVYPLEIYLEDETGLHIDGAECTVTFSDGSKEKRVLKSGRVKFKEAPLGKFKIEVDEYEFVFEEIGKIVAARWEKTKAKCGEEVKMFVRVEDFEDGTPAKFTIWEEDIDGKNDKIERIEGKVQSNKVEASWVYSPEQLKGDLEQDVKEKEEGEPKYFFDVEINGKKKRSGILTFTYPLDIYLEDEDENPLNDVEYTVTFSDKTKRKGKFKDGWAKIEDAPYGLYFLEVEGYDLIFGDSDESEGAHEQQ